MSRDIEAVVRISGDLDATLRKAIKEAADQIEQLDDAAKQSADAVDLLSSVMDDQEDALKKAQKQYAAYVLSGEVGSKQAKDLAKKIKSLSSELNDNRSRMQAAEDAAQRLSGGLDDTGDSAADSKGGFSIMKGAIADLVSSGIQFLISKCADAVSSIYGLADSTREFRQDMGTLETAFDNAGFSADAATDTWKELYGVFGEDDRAVEAANNIARMADSQKDLDNWVKITTGIWGTYQDALPVESLAEAASETINTGTVTGTLADALNWSSDAAEMFASYMGDDVVTAEDAFNVALSKCTTEAERNALVTDTLTALYGSAADKYRETAGSIIEANEANADYNMTLAELGEQIEPVTTAVKSGLAGLLQRVLELTKNVDISAFTDKIAAGFEWVGEKIMPIAESVFPQIMESAGELAKELLPLAGEVIPPLVDAFGEIKNAMAPVLPVIANAAKTLLPALSESIGSIVSAIAPVIPVAAQLINELLPLAMVVIQAVTPIISTLATALAPIVAAIGQIVSNLVPPLIQIIEVLSPILQVLATIISSSVGYALQFIMPIIDDVTSTFSSLIDFIQNIFLGNWSEAWENMKSIFSSAFSALSGLAKAPLNAVISIVNGAIDGINSIGFDIPDWVPIIGGKKFQLDIPNIPMLATGGFTDGPSIAGEAGMEAVISFDRSVREANIGYWARAGRLLGATADDAGFSLSGDSYSNSTVIDMGGVTFAPNINISGSADKQSVVKAIEDEYPEFLDMLENWLYERGLPVFG